MSARQFHYKKIDYQADKKSFYREYRVNTGHGKEGYTGCYVDILDKLINHLEDERARFDVLFIGRFDMVFNNEVEQPSIEEQQEIMKTFLNKVKSYLSKKTVEPKPLRNHKSPKIGWAREYGKDKQWHYHCYICLDGERVTDWGKGKGSLYTMIDYYWEQCTGIYYQPVHINNPKKRKDRKNHWLVNQSVSGDIQFYHAVYSISYLSKFRDKRDNKSLKYLASHSIPKLKKKNVFDGALGEWVKRVVNE